MDKLFLADKVGNSNIFIDFGCGDGALLRAMQKLFPEHLYLGYDNNPDMVKCARKQTRGNNPAFVGSLDELVAFKEKHRGTTCLILSSVLHEIYHYGPAEVENFWRFVWSIGFDYIAMRDMCVSRTASRPADPISAARIRQVFDPDKLVEWESNWGSLDENWSLVHFLLHYRYLDNWTREVRENYLPINMETLLQKVNTSYFPIFVEHYTLPFLREQVWLDFAIQLQERTHLKLILKRK